MTDEKEVTFDPAEYAYMDSMPRRGWMWEFMRRVEEYRNHYAKFLECVDKGDVSGITNIFYKGCPFDNPLGMADPRLGWNEIVPTGGQDAPTKLFPIAVHNMQWRRFVDNTSDNPANQLLLLPHAEIDINDGNIDEIMEAVGQRRCMHPSRLWLMFPKDMRFLEHARGLSSRSFVKIPLTNTKGSDTVTFDVSEYARQGHPLMAFRKAQGSENIVMALIDISAPEPVERLLEEIKDGIAQWKALLQLPTIRSPKKPKKTPNALVGTGTVWKDYLIIYDLAAQGVSVKRIRKILQEHDKANYRLTDTVRKKLKAAMEMIDGGGYQKYFVA